MQIPCSEPGCKESIDFELQPVQNAAEYVTAAQLDAKARAEDQKGKPHTFYLTCPAGHIHRYVLLVS